MKTDEASRKNYDDNKELRCVCACVCVCVCVCVYSYSPVLFRFCDNLLYSSQLSSALFIMLTWEMTFMFRFPFFIYLLGTLKEGRVFSSSHLKQTS